MLCVYMYNVFDVDVDVAFVRFVTSLRISGIRFMALIFDFYFSISFL